jgi:hypothetical protein
MSEWFKIEDKDDVSLSEDGTTIHVLFASNDWGNQYIEIPLEFLVDKFEKYLRLKQC